MDNFESHTFYQIQTSDLENTKCSEISNDVCLLEACQIDLVYVKKILNWRINKGEGFSSQLGVCEFNMNLETGLFGGDVNCQ